MTHSAMDLSPRAAARTAGIGYLIIIAAGLFAEFFVRSRLLAPGDAAATATGILASEGLFRLGFVSDLVMIAADVLVGWALYVLLRPAGRHLAVLALILRVAHSAMLGVNLLNHVSALLVLQEAGPLAGAFEPGQLQAMALYLLDAHGHGYLIAQVLFGLHCVVLGALLLRADYMPGVLGVLILLASVAYLAESFGVFLLPAHEAFFGSMVIVPAVMGELALCLWLLIKGVRTRSPMLEIEAA